MNEFRVLVCGSRSLDNRGVSAGVDSWLSSYHNKWNAITEIIHGGAVGPDSFAGEWAKRHSVKETVVYPDWNKHGRAAGIIRNNEMLAMHPDMVLAFYDGVSRGTLHTINQAKLLNIMVHTVLVEEL